MVGQKFVELLSVHPWFKITALAASERSSGKKYREAMRWMMPSTLCDEAAEIILSPCLPELPCKVVFSGLDASVAGPIEESFALAGYFVVSNSRSHRMDADVPLLIPEVNSAHLELLYSQRYPIGKLVTNPNCSVIGLTMALKPLADLWGLDQVHVVTLQALSGAGYPGIPSFDTLDNVIPYIAGEEEKIEKEPLKILGALFDNAITPYSMRLSAHCNRVSVIDGHMACVSLKLQKKANASEIISAWKQFTAPQEVANLPLAPQAPIVYFDDDAYPQPKLHRYLGKGMSVSLGRLRPCSLFEWKFTLLCHNTMRGAAGCGVLNAELMLKKGFF
jgi:aspartate-semialdehyde dehydrogenase